MEGVEAVNKSCEVEDFSETHLCKYHTCDTPIARATGFIWPHEGCRLVAPLGDSSRISFLSMAVGTAEGGVEAVKISFSVSFLPLWNGRGEVEIVNKS